MFYIGFYKDRAFSVVQMMVVVLIVGILAGIAAPNYLRYTRRSQVAEGIQLMKAYAKEYEQYAAIHGALLTSTPETTLVTPNNDNVNRIVMGSNSSQGTGMFLYVVFQNSLGFGSNNRVLLGMVINKSTGVISTYCGQWQTTLYVPVEFLPSTCNTTNISAIPGFLN